MESRLYNYFRYYDPKTGRYIQSDRIGLGDGPNTYAYVLNNPLIYINPNGLACIAFNSYKFKNCSDTVDIFVPEVNLPGDEIRCAGGDMGACARDTSSIRAVGYIGCAMNSLSLQVCGRVDEFYEKLDRENAEEPKQCELGD